MARRLLTCCWDSLILILKSGLNIQESKTGRLLKISKKTLTTNSNKLYASVYGLSLEAIQSLATLSNSLQLQHFAGKILNLIANNVCSGDNSKSSAANALSIEVILTKGLELGSVSPECWPPIFQIVRCLGQYEHEMFSQNVKNPNLSNINVNDSPQKNVNNNSIDDNDDETW